MEHLEGCPAAPATLHVASMMSNKDIPHSTSRGQASATPCGGPPSMAAMAQSQWIWRGYTPCALSLDPRGHKVSLGAECDAPTRECISVHPPHALAR